MAFRLGCPRKRAHTLESIVPNIGDLGVPPSDRVGRRWVQAVAGGCASGGVGTCSGYVLGTRRNQIALANGASWFGSRCIIATHNATGC